MRAAHFVQRYPPALGGSEAYFARLSQFLTAAGDAVTVFTTTALALEGFWSVRAACLPAGESLIHGVRVRRYPLWRCPGRRYLLKPLSLFPHRFWQCLTLPCNPISRRMWVDAGKGDTPFDVVHATAFPYAWPIACALRLARRLRVPFLITPFLHLGDPGDPRDPSRRGYLAPPFLFLLREADRIFVQTESEYAALVDRGVPREKLVRQGLGVDAAECTGGDREATRRRWEVTGNDVVIGHLANHSIEKGTVDLLRAAQALWLQGRRLVVALAGPDMPNFRRFWSSFTPGGKVLRLGVLDDVQKRDFFAAIDVFALPSRSDSFGLVLLEAWANGVPNVAYRAGGVADLVQDGRDGLLVRCGDVAGLAQALEWLSHDVDVRNRLGWRGRARLAQEFSWQDKLALVRETYAEVVRSLPALVSTPAGL